METHFDLRVVFPQQGGQAPAREKVFVIALEHVPRRGEMIPQVAEQFAIGHRHDELARGNAADFAQERFWIVERWSTKPYSW